MLRVGFLDQREALPPRFQIWRCSAADWVDGLSDLPADDRQDRFETMRTTIRT